MNQLCLHPLVVLLEACVVSFSVRLPIAAIRWFGLLPHADGLSLAPGNRIKYDKLLALHFDSVGLNIPYSLFCNAG